jgi:hypothetical protein
MAVLKVESASPVDTRAPAAGTGPAGCRTPGRAGWIRARSGARLVYRNSLVEGFPGKMRGVLGLFFVCCLYSVDVIKSAKGAYLEISSSSKH